MDQLLDARLYMYDHNPGIIPEYLLVLQLTCFISIPPWNCLEKDIIYSTYIHTHKLIMTEILIHLKPDYPGISARLGHK